MADELKPLSLETFLAETSAGLVCLVPRPGVGGITCHEKTICDCQVLKLIAVARELKSQRDVGNRHLCQRGFEITSTEDDRLLKIISGESEGGT